MGEASIWNACKASCIDANPLAYRIPEVNLAWNAFNAGAIAVCELRDDQRYELEFEQIGTTKGNPSPEQRTPIDAAPTHPACSAETAGMRWIRIDGELVLQVLREVGGLTGQFRWLDVPVVDPEIPAGVSDDAIPN